MRFKKICVIVNPASGQSESDVELIEKRLSEKGLDYRVVYTEPDRLPREIAKDAAADGADLVVAVGGDGTVLETAEGLIGTDTVLGVIPGGTANVFAAEMEIPVGTCEALDFLLCDDMVVRKVDIGVVGEQHFLLRVGVGLEAAMTVLTEPGLKSRFGVLAYLWTALHYGRTMPNTRYSITADGRRRMMSGITCVVCNSGNLGIQGVKLIPEIDPSDGYLNVVVFRQASLIAALGLAYNAISGFVTRRKGAGRVRVERKDLTMYSIPAKEVVIEASPPQVAARDGEEINGGFPLRIGVLHNAINVAAHRREWE